MTVDVLGLQGEKATKVATALSNKKSTQIMELLAHKAMTESEIATKLKLPLSTVHYTMKKLVEAGLIVSKQYHYSSKGKEVQHYELVNQVVVFSPHSLSLTRQLLQSIIPAVLVLVSGAWLFRPQSAPVEAFSAMVASDSVGIMEESFAVARMASEPVAAVDPVISPWVLFIGVGIAVSLLNLAYVYVYTKAQSRQKTATHTQK